jgi:hypothetical protein
MMSRLSNLVKRHPLITFFVLTYVITWGGIPFMGFNAGGPFIAALIAIPLTQGLAGFKELGSRLIRWRVRWYWYAVALSLPLAIHLLNVGLSVTAGMGIPPQHFTSLTGLLLYFALRLARVRPPGAAEHPLAAGVHRNPRGARYRLASAPFLLRGRLAAVGHRGQHPGPDHVRVRGHMALQPHRWQRAPDHRHARRRREYQCGGLDLCGAVGGCSDWFGRL